MGGMMQEFLGFIFVLGATFLSVAALIALFKPLPRLYMGTRKRAGLGIGLSFLLMLIGGGLLPEPKGNATAPARSADAAKEADNGKPGPTAKVDMIAYYDKFLDTVASCDRAGKVVADTAQSGDAVSAYQAADRMESACLSTSREIKDIDVPESVGAEIKEELAETIKACESAYINKWAAAGSMKKALDNSGSVSAQAEMRDAIQAFQGPTLVCVAGLTSAATKAGVKADELKRS